jgi:hypothetical protein
LGLDKHDERSGSVEGAAGNIQPKIFFVGCEWDKDSLISRHAENFTQRLQDADDAITMPAGPEILANCMLGDSYGKKIGDNVRADHADALSRVAFGLAPEAAGVNRHGVDFKHRRGGDRADCNCVGFLIATLDRHRIVRRDAGAPTRTAQAKDRLRVIFSDVFALIELDEIFARSDYARTFGDGENGRTWEEKVCATVWSRPLMMVTTAITAVTPTMIPISVSPVRNLFWRRLATATRKASQTAAILKNPRGRSLAGKLIRLTTGGSRGGFS